MWDFGVCWGKLGIVLASSEQGACNLMGIVGALTSVGDIWSGIGLVGTYHGAGAGATAAVRNVLARDQCLLEIFGLRPKSVGEVWSETV